MRVVLLSAEDEGKGRVLLKTQNTFEIEGEDKLALMAEVLAGPRDGDVELSREDRCPLC